MGARMETATVVASSSELPGLLWRIHRERGVRAFDIVAVGREGSVKLLEKMREFLLNNHVFHVRIYVARPGEEREIVDKLASRSGDNNIILVFVDTETPTSSQGGG